MTIIELALRHAEDQRETAEILCEEAKRVYLDALDRLEKATRRELELRMEIDKREAANV